jgi:hypothetical protein
MQRLHRAASNAAQASERGEDAELVAFRVGEDRPRDVALAHVGGRRAESLQPGNLRRLIVTKVRPEVEMDGRV